MEIDTISFSTSDTTSDSYPGSNMGVIAHLNHEGDTKYSWDRTNPVECEAAREHFENLKKKGFLAFKVNRATGAKQKKPVKDFDPKAGNYVYLAPEMVDEFDPKADYVVTPQMQGG